MMELKNRLKNGGMIYEIRLLNGEGCRFFCVGERQCLLHLQTSII